MRIKQGDAYNIDIVLTTDAGDPITDRNAAVVEISLGGLIKTWPGELIYVKAAEWPGYGEVDDHVIQTEESGGETRFTKVSWTPPDFSMFTAGDIVDISGKVSFAENETTYPHGSDFALEGVKVLSGRPGYQIAIEYTDEDFSPAGLEEMTIKKQGSVHKFVFPLSQGLRFGWRSRAGSRNPSPCSLPCSLR